MKTKEEIKSALRDWMVATSTLVRVQVANNSEVSFWWRYQFGIKMQDRWIEKHLGGRAA